MAGMTITEGLAEIKTIGKRIDKKIQFIGQYLARTEGVKDPLAKDGGSQAVIASERQAINDLWNRIVAIRLAIADANRNTSATVYGFTRPISEWLVWRREVAPRKQTFLGSLRTGIEQARAEAKRRGTAIATSDTGNPNDVVVSIDERELLKDVESIEAVLGELDGRLSLHNATATINV